MVVSEQHQSGVVDVEHVEHREVAALGRHIEPAPLGIDAEDVGSAAGGPADDGMGSPRARPGQPVVVFAGDEGGLAIGVQTQAMRTGAARSPWHEINARLERGLRALAALG
jgi:hypothetical protein